ncbi:MAG: acylphosphatase [candidate division WOR-3 bacterium]
MPESTEKAALYCVVSGLVQGVFFRVFVLREAQQLKLTGRVKNLPDGRVEVRAEGPKDKLETLVARLRQGPRGAVVQDVVVEWGDFLHEYDDFQIDY